MFYSTTVLGFQERPSAYVRLGWGTGLTGTHGPHPLANRPVSSGFLKQFVEKGIEVEPWGPGKGME